MKSLSELHRTNVMRLERYPDLYRLIIALFSITNAGKKAAVELLHADVIIFVSAPFFG